MTSLFKKYIGGLLVGVGLLVACNGDHQHQNEDHGHDHDSDEKHLGGDEEHQESAKIVELNQAQYENAEIVLGEFILKNLSDVVNANGYTKLDPQDEADVSLPVSGTIQSVSVIEGNFVKKGQTLAKMQSLDYNRMLLERAKLQEELVVSESNLVYLNLDLKRQASLAEENINAKKVLEKVQSEFEMENAKIKSVREQIQIVSQIIDMIGQGSNSTINIKAPITGYITDVHVKIGSLATPGEVLFSIVDNSKMHVDLLVYEKDLSKVRIGQTVRFILTNQSNKEIKGEIYNIGKAFANETKSVAVHADIEKNDANLIPGMYINALIDIGSNELETLPEEAIVHAEGKDFIFVLKGDTDHHETDNHEGHSHGEEEHEHTMDSQEQKKHFDFERLEVRTGAKQLGYVQVTLLQEMDQGDKIVSQGSYYLQSHLQKMASGGGHSH